MDIDFSPQVHKKLVQIKRRDQHLFRQIEKQLRLFRQNPRHPSLRSHKLKGQLQETWSISVGMEVHLTYYMKVIENQKRAVFFAIGTHDQVYR